MITLFGATGYTGTRIANVLDREKLPFRLAGRSNEKLKMLSESLSTHPAWITADALDPSSIPALFKDTKVLINCVGPFTDMGEKILSMAAISGVHYLDTTNELGFVYRAKTYHALAQRSGAAIVPACAFEVALADCAAALLAQAHPGSYDSADIIYHLSGKGASRGTRLSMLRTLATSWISFTNGAWIGSIPVRARQWFELESGRVAALSFPSSESATLSVHLQVKDIATWMSGGAISTVFAALLVPLFARFLRSWPGRSVLWAAGQKQNTNETEIRPGAPFEVKVILKMGPTSHSLSVHGTGVYEVTAEIAVFAARGLLQNPPPKGGVLAPAQLLAPALFFEAAQAWGVHCSPADSAGEP